MSLYGDYEGDLVPELFEDLGGDAGELELEDGGVRLFDYVMLGSLIGSGNRDENDITNQIFFARHPGLPHAPLRKNQPELVSEWLQIRDQIVRPGLSKAGAGSAPLPSPPSTGGQVPDGKTPLPGTQETRQGRATNPPYRSQPGQRDPKTYTYVLDQFAVGVNPRYAHSQGRTWCNIFLWDVTRAMGAEIPHYVDSSGSPAAVGKGNELNANATNAWLQKHGARFGWRQVDLDQAVAAANAGCPAVVSWKNPTGGHGHVAVIRPSQPSSQGPWMAQAGATNSNRIRLWSGGPEKGVFRKGAAVKFFVHD